MLRVRAESLNSLSTDSPHPSRMLCPRSVSYLLCGAGAHHTGSVDGLIRKLRERGEQTLS